MSVDMILKVIENDMNQTWFKHYLFDMILKDFMS